MGRAFHSKSVCLSSIKYNTIALIHVNRTLAMRAPTEMALLGDPAVGDPASKRIHVNIQSGLNLHCLGIGGAVLLANWTKTNLSDNTYGYAASQQLRYLLDYAPRTQSGAISQRTDQVQLWYVNVIKGIVLY
jgi:hypothetical protein